MSEPTALVTGATEGIGQAIVRALAGAGYRVGVVARTAERVEEVAAELRRGGARAVGAAADVADPAAVAAAVSRIENELGPIELLVNNAGILITKPFVETSLEEWDRLFAVNVRSLYLVTHAVLPGMLARGRGDIVNIASLAGKNGVQNAAGYSATKHAVLGFSRSLMLETRKQGVRVIAICPGSVATPMMREQSAFAVVLDRILDPDDVAAAVLTAVRLPPRAMVSELDVRPANP